LRSRNPRQRNFCCLWPPSLVDVHRIWACWTRVSFTPNSRYCRHYLPFGPGNRRAALGADAWPRRLTIIALMGSFLLIGNREDRTRFPDDRLPSMRRREPGLSVADADLPPVACAFRPILMTTVAAIFGALPFDVRPTGTGPSCVTPWAQHRRAVFW